MLDSLLGSPMLGQTLRHLGRSSTAGQLRYLSSARTLVVLALESSADDTCAAVLSSAPGARTRILSNVVLKQSHEALGGIEPLKAQLLHQERMPSAVQLALREAGVTLAELDGIAFTRGPGMLGCLSVCASAKTLAGATGLPLLGVHHMQAHALTVFLTEPNPPAFPFLTLLLSGGHTMLVLAKSEASFTILANCNDESIGACFDKGCRALQIDWALGNGSPGAALEKYADFSTWDRSAPPPPSTPLHVPLPVFRIPFKTPTMEFSYSGLRSALTRHLLIEDPASMSPERKQEIARRYMAAAFDQVAEKVKLGLKWWEESDNPLPLGGIVCSGGVASNQFLRIRVRETLDGLGFAALPQYFPPPALCTDNAAMIAHVGISRLRRGRVDGLGVMSRAKWSIEQCEEDFES